MQLGHRRWFGRTTRRDAVGSPPAENRDKTRSEFAFSEREPYSRSRHRGMPMEVRAIFIVVLTRDLWLIVRVIVIIPHAQKRTKVSLLLCAKIHKFCFFAYNSKLAVVRFYALAAELMKIGMVEVLGGTPPFPPKTSTFIGTHSYFSGLTKNCGCRNAKCK